MRLRLLSVLAVLPFLTPACSREHDAGGTPDSAGGVRATTADAGNARQAIDSAMARYVDAVERADTAAIAASLTDDAVIVMPAGPAWKGRPDVMKGFAAMLAASSVKELKPTTSERVVSGDVAVETGTFEVTMQPKGAREMTEKGQYMLVWQRQSDGSWKMLRGFNRSDAPPRS